MPTQFHRINVTSPLVQYLDGRWRPVRLGLSPVVVCIENQNDDAKCSASLQFIGKNITLSLVDIVCDAGHGNSSACTTYANTPSLSEGLHKFDLTASNVGLSYFNLSSTVASINDLRVQDDAAFAFRYDPPDAWRRNMSSSPGFDGGNVHTTNQSNASVTFSFEGDRVALYGSLGAQGGYTAQLDNRLTLEIAPSLLSPVGTSFPELIFFAAGLDAGGHIVTLISTSPEVFTVDYAVVDADMNPDILSASSSSTMSPGTSILPNIPGESIGLSGARLIGLIAGVAVLLALLLIALGCIVCLRRRRIRREKETPHSFNDFPPPHPTGATPTLTEHTQTSQQPLFLAPQPQRTTPTTKHTQTSQQPLFLVPQPRRTSWDARSFDSRSYATLDESSEGYQAEVYVKHKFDSYGFGLSQI
ncbi:hypothetical protein B0H14DRAFT_2699869 [Mycena olivaceomarginata]|nr:hypothetical protein B0H14DRAFT_2699869 [Mycena olivaceomarginata]